MKVDTRLLKAVAIEHAKDPDKAVETILTEVLPFTSEKSNVATPIGKSLNFQPWRGLNASRCFCCNSS